MKGQIEKVVWDPNKWEEKENKYIKKKEYSIPDILESVANYNKMVEGVNEIREIMRSGRVGPYPVLYL